jgi:sugar phosphate permease
MLGIRRTVQPPAAISSATCIWDLYEQRKWILLAWCFCVYMLIPFTDTILLPQLARITSDIGITNKGEVTPIISCYMVALALGLLVWGAAVGERNEACMCCSQ